ncbi:hypothetical protein D3C86_2050780 [compost metagenome]
MTSLVAETSEGLWKLLPSAVPNDGRTATLPLLLIVVAVASRLANRLTKLFILPIWMVMLSTPVDTIILNALPYSSKQYVDFCWPVVASLSYVSMS